MFWFFLLCLYYSLCQAYLTKALCIYIAWTVILTFHKLHFKWWPLNTYGFYCLHCAFTDNICYQTLYLVLRRRLKFLSLQERRLQDAGILCILVRRGIQEYTFESEHMPEMKRAHVWENLLIGGRETNRPTTAPALFTVTRRKQY